MSLTPNFDPDPDLDSAPPPRRSSGRKGALALIVIAAILIGGYAWQRWQQRSSSEHAAVASSEQRLDAFGERFDAFRTEQRAQARRLQQADATNRVIRDDLLGISQRAALIEDSVSRLADPDRHGAQALRLDEVELLLTLGQQRLLIAADLDGARRAYALAGGVLDGIDDPAYLSLRQTLLQEAAALDALKLDPRVHAMMQLDAFATRLGTAPSAAQLQSQSRSSQTWWQRLLGVTREVGDERVLLRDDRERAATQAGLQLELSLARAAAERRDEAGYRAALDRANAALTRLWPPSPALQQHRAQLQTVRALPLTLTVPTLGTTLQQLRQQRAR